MVKQRVVICPECRKGELLQQSNGSWACSNPDCSYTTLKLPGSGSISDFAGLVFAALLTVLFVLFAVTA